MTRFGPGIATSCKPSADLHQHNSATQTVVVSMSPQCIAGLPASMSATAKIKKDTQSTFTGQSTVVKMLRANEDKTVTAMIPASVRVRREQGVAPARQRSHAGASAMLGFGLMPTSLSSHVPSTAPKPAVPSGADSKYQDFLAEMNALGAMTG